MISGHSSLSAILAQELLENLTKLDTVKGVNKNFVEVNNTKKGNLFPRNYKHFFLVMLRNQDKWNKVFDKFIENVDEIESKPIAKTKEMVKAQ